MSAFWCSDQWLLSAFLISLQMIMLMRPWLERYALVSPNARSSHQRPTPQGGGIAVVVATLVVAWGAVDPAPACSTRLEAVQFLAVTAAAALLALVGAIDDIRTLPAALRLVLQCVAVGAVIAALPTELQILPLLPWWVERACLFVGGVWFVNLVNFMDGIDWMTVAEVVPVTGAIVAARPVRRGGAVAAVWSRSRCSARSSALRRSTGRSRGCFSATSAACRSACCSAGSCSMLCGQRPSRGGAHPAALLSRRRHHHAAAPHRAGRAVLAGASHPFLSARDRSAASPFRRSSAACSWSISRWPRLRSLTRRVAGLASSCLRYALAAGGGARRLAALAPLRAASAEARAAHAASPPKSGTASRSTPIDHRAVLARQALLQRREPAAHRLERRADRLRRHDAVDADLARSAPRARTGSRAAARPAGCR